MPDVLDRLLAERLAAVLRERHDFAGSNEVRPLVCVAAPLRDDVIDLRRYCATSAHRSFREDRRGAGPIAARTGPRCVAVSSPACVEGGVARGGLACWRAVNYQARCKVSAVGEARLVCVAQIDQVGYSTHRSSTKGGARCWERSVRLVCRAPALGPADQSSARLRAAGASRGFL